MVARRSQRFTSEGWSGHWGADARYYARRSDGACFAIDAGVAVFDLAQSGPPASMAQRLPSIPAAGRYALRMIATRSESRSVSRSESGSDSLRETPSEPPRESRRLVVCGTRRPTPR
jgi:hypothetical protein